MVKVRLNVKVIILTMLFAIIACLLCGCMYHNYSEPILNYLEEKYSYDFNILQLTKEWNGHDGSYLRAVCECTALEGWFELYGYLDDSRLGDRVTISGDDYVISDDFGDILFAHQLEDEIRGEIGDTAFIKCQITFSNHFITTDEYKSGLKDCLENTDLYSHVTVYVITDESHVQDIRETVETICLKYNAYRQYLYFAVSNNADTSEIQRHYAKYQDSYDQHLNECELIDKVYFSLIKRDKGIIQRSVEKE